MSRQNVLHLAFYTQAPVTWKANGICEKKKYIYGLPRSDESLWWPNLSHLASCVD